MVRLTLISLCLLAGVAGSLAVPTKPKSTEEEAQPKITYSKETLTQDGEDVKLDCAVVGVDLGGVEDFGVSWSKIDEENPTNSFPISANDKILLFSSKYAIDHPADSYQYSLVIKEVGDEDTGMYRCTVNFGGEQKINAEVPVHIQKAPFFTDDFTKTLTVTEGDAISIDCQPGGWPKPDVYWERLGQELPYYGGKFFKSNQLDIPLIERDHEGHYVCYADNNIGDPANSHIILEVQFAPEVIVEEKQVFASPSEPVKMSYVKLYLLALDGFIMTVSCSGRVLYTSESITSLMGYLPSDLAGTPLYDLMLEEERGEMKRFLSNPALAPNPNTWFEDNKDGVLDFSCSEAEDSLSLSNCSRSGAGGLFQSSLLHSQLPQESSTKVVFVAIGRMERPQLVREMMIIEPSKTEFTSRHSLEWKFLFLDHRAPTIIGYLPFEVLGTSGYDYYHVEDLEKVASCHEQLMKTGKGTSCYYRFLTKGQQWICLDLGNCDVKCSRAAFSRNIGVFGKRSVRISRVKYMTFIKSRNLSEKKRRDQFNLLINELSSMVASNNRKMDKSTVLKATIAFLKNQKGQGIPCHCATGIKIFRVQVFFISKCS
ncbi:uncharacterized protein LOC134778097 [Penaeus indicus]|uniref:uncharacterized protein LOC134778097 n=1 Tax=Penaeus indicus TaxID=29960 RepID=UPI00300D3880